MNMPKLSGAHERDRDARFSSRWRDHVRRDVARHESAPASSSVPAIRPRSRRLRPSSSRSWTMSTSPRHLHSSSAYAGPVRWSRFVAVFGDDFEEVPAVAGAGPLDLVAASPCRSAVTSTSAMTRRPGAARLRCGVLVRWRVRDRGRARSRGSAQMRSAMAIDRVRAESSDGAVGARGAAAGARARGAVGQVGRRRRGCWPASGSGWCAWADVSRSRAGAVVS